MRSAVFVDREGLINQHRPDDVGNRDHCGFLPGALTSLRRLARSSHVVALISSQPAIKRGLPTPREANHVDRRMLNQIESVGGRVDGIYACPHRPDEACGCWNPKPRLLHKAADELNIDLERSYFVGDTLSAVRAALAAGCTPVLVLTDRACQELEKECRFYPKGFFVAPDLAGSVDSILEWSGSHQSGQGHLAQTHHLAANATHH